MTEVVTSVIRRAILPGIVHKTVVVVAAADAVVATVEAVVAAAEEDPATTAARVDTSRGTALSLLLLEKPAISVENQAI